MPDADHVRAHGKNARSLHDSAAASNAVPTDRTADRYLVAFASKTRLYEEKHR